MRDVLRAHPRRDARAARGGRAHALHRPPRGRRARAARADGLGRGARPPRNDRITLFVAFNYGGRAEILDAARALRRRRPRTTFRALLYAPEMHDPDLVIRTSGEQRLSNYLLWQSAYSELVFRDELWPDFTREAFERALAEYARASAASGAAEPCRARGRAPPARPPAAATGRSARAPRRVGPRRADRCVAIPALAFALAIIVAGRLGRSSPASALLGLICLHELFAHVRARAAGAAGRGFLGLVGAAAGGRALGDRDTVLLVFVGVPAAALPGRRRQPRRRRGAGHGGDDARASLDRPRARPRGAAARAAARRRARVRRARRHVRRRHRRLPRRPRVRPRAARAARSRRTRPSRGWSSASSSASAAVWFAGLYQDWLGGTRR